MAKAPVTPTSFAKSVLIQLKAPTTPANVKSLVGWEAREGGNWANSANANPLNTTEDAPGAGSMNSVGVKSYANWKQGLNATVRTLENGKYGDIIGALKSGKGLENGSYSGLSTWSGGGYSNIAPDYGQVAPGGRIIGSNQQQAQVPGAAGPVSVPKARTAAVNGFTTKTTYHKQPGGLVPTTASDRQAYISNAADAVISAGHASSFSEDLLASLAHAPPPLMKRGPAIEIGTTTRIPNHALATVAQKGDNPQNLGVAASMAVSKDPRLESFNKLIASADFIDKQHFNYEWAGGHNPSFAPTTGSGHGSGPGIGYDCSGVLSHILEKAGLLNTPLASGQMMDLGKYIPSAKQGPGSGPHSITVYANADHTFSKIGDQYFGTSSQFNPGGGAGFWSVKEAGPNWVQEESAATGGPMSVWHIDF